jgi:indole-3-glycerol phosphate synthase
MILQEVTLQSLIRAAQIPPLAMPEMDDPVRSLGDAIRRSPAKNPVIAEIKPASPASGTIRSEPDVGEIAAGYERAGGTAISVLTEPIYFKGREEYLRTARDSSSLPLLRKDFIVDPRQVSESRALGADAVLLIAGLLGDRLMGMMQCCYDLTLEPLVEVHTREEAFAARDAGARLIAVNNRDLSSLSLSLQTTADLAPIVRGGSRVVISASGYTKPEEVSRMRPYCDAFLIGSALMRSFEPAIALREFLCA